MESIYRQFFREITQTFMKEDFPWIQIMVWNVSKKLCTYVEQLLCKINTFIIFRQINWDLELSWFWNNALIFVNSHWLYWLKWSQNHERVKSKIGNVPKFSWNQKRRSFYLSMKLSPICEFSGHSLQSISLTLVWEKFRESNVFKNELLYIELIWRSFF